jgi:dihydroxyacid dehydratase/phosphogluconate dehydratase
VLLGCALRRSAVAALTDGRCSGGFTLEATVGARHANTPELSL